MTEKKIKNQELGNALSHGLGILLCLSFSPMLIAKTVNLDNPYLSFGVAFYCFTLLLMFCTSTIYHAVTHPEIKKTLRILDHISIFFLIGGSYVPFIIAFVENTAAVRFLAIQWGLISFCIVLKLFFTGKFKVISSLIYILIGGLIFFFDFNFWNKIPSKAINFIGIGGASYLIGVFFYLNHKIPYHHIIWHLFVLIAAFSHLFAVGLALGVF